MPQENNMGEVLRLLHTVIVKVDDLASDTKEVKTDVGVLKTDVRELRGGLQRLDGKVDLLTGRFEDVAGVVMKDTQRISGLKTRVDILESKAN